MQSLSDRGACPLCRGTDVVGLLEVDAKPYWRCRSCLLTFLGKEGFLPAQAARAHYLTHENRVDDLGYHGFLSRLAEPMLTRLAARSRGLDYGCGPGSALAQMFREHGHEVAVYDPFFAADEAPLSSTYDFVTCTEVAEHFHDPAREFARVDALLNRGGWLGIMTCFQTDDEKFAAWHYRRDPTHVAFYKRETLAFVARRMGWSFESPAKDVALMQKP